MGEVTEDLSTLAYAAQEALDWLRETNAGYPIDEFVQDRINWARSNLSVLSKSLTALDKKAKGGMS